MSLTKKLKKIELKSRVYSLKTKDIIIKYTDNLDGIIDDMTNDDFGEDERFPYFFNIWDSGPVLANWMIENISTLKDSTILELGSGTGVTGIVLATTGSRVILTDYEELSVNLCTKNAESNGIENFSCLQADWRLFPDINEKIDIIACSDLLYEKKQVIPLYDVCKSFLKKNAVVYISDPGRGHIDTFKTLLKNDNFSVEQVYEKKNEITELRNIKIYKIS